MYLIKAEQIPKCDLIGSCDSYVCLEYASSRCVTAPPIHDTLNPEYLMQLNLPYAEPSFSNMMKLSFFLKCFST